MKIAQYKCSLPAGGFRSFAVDSLETLADAPYDHEILIWNNNVPFGAEELAFFPSLKLFINWGVDDTCLDQTLLEQKGIQVKKVDFNATETLAEYTLSLLLLFERKHSALQAGQKIVGGELYGKKIGIIGMGKIGFGLARMLRKAFACQIFYYATQDKQLPDYTFASVETIFAECDYAILATRSSTFTIDLATMPRINPQLVVVNIARNSVLPIQEALPLLRAGRLGGFIGDLGVDYTALGALPENVLLMPHRGYLTQAAADAKHDILAFYLSRVLGRPWRLYIVRHGETDWNKRGVVQGSMDSPLSSAGKRHALAMAKHLRGRGIKTVFTSPLGRSRATAEIIAEDIGTHLVEVPAFAEMNFGIFEGKPKAAIEQLFDDFFKRRSQSELYKLFVPYPEGESYYDVFLRVLRPMLRILANQETCVIVGHEGVNRMLRGLATEQQLTAMVQSHQKNNEIVCLDMASGLETVTLL